MKTLRSQRRQPDRDHWRGDASAISGGVTGIVGRLMIFGIWLYRNTLGLVFPPSCRFHPSCSEYATEALKRFGPLKGGWISARRLLRCHPFHPGGYDPLP